MAAGRRCRVYCCARDEHSERPAFLALTKNFRELEVKEVEMPISSDEVNYLVYRYLKESGKDSVWSDKGARVLCC